MNTLKENLIKSSTELKNENIEYVLRKYLNRKLCYKAIFSSLDDGKLASIMKDIKEAK